MTTVKQNVKNVTDNKVNKELKAEFLNLLFSSGKFTESDKKYYTSSIEDVVKISDTEYFYIDKPYIKKSFCFGHGMYGISTDEDSERASNNANRARTDITYFINENLSEINHKIAMVEYNLIPKENWEERENYFKNAEKQGYMRYGNQMCTPYITAPYISSHGKFQVSISYFKVGYWQDELEIKRDYVLRVATDEELKIILAFYKRAKERLIKRLNTYLKKYGLEKLHVWTYLVD